MTGVNQTKPRKSAAPKMKPAPSAFQSLLDRLKEKSTWAGILTIGATFATGGTAAWLNPTTVPVILAGLGLVLTKDGE